MEHRFVDELEFGFGWHPDEAFVRTGHALASDGRVWLVDPVDGPGLDKRIRALGEPAGVVQLLDRHNRDGAELATRLGVPHHIVPDALPGAPFELVPLVRWPKWRESALWWPERSVLVTADALGTTRFFAGAEPVGVHPFLRLVKPPRGLLRYQPEHLLVGHGAGLHGPDTAAAIRAAVNGARTGFPRWTAGLAADIARGRIS